MPASLLLYFPASSPTHPHGSNPTTSLSQLQQYLTSTFQVSSSSVSVWRVATRLYRCSVADSGQPTAQMQARRRESDDSKECGSCSDIGIGRVMYLCTSSGVRHRRRSGAADVAERTWCHIYVDGGAEPAATAGKDQGKEKSVKIVAERELENLVGRLKNIWTVRQSCKVDGFSLEVGDLIIRIGNIIVGNQMFSGIVIELCYTPAAVSLSTTLTPLFQDLIKHYISPFFTSLSTSQSNSSGTTSSPVRSKPAESKVKYGLPEGIAKIASSIGDDTDVYIDLFRGEGIL